MKKTKIKKIALSALFVAVITACAWLSIPTPFGINLTITLFGVGLAGFLLGVKGALAATGAYILLGALGMPVFSQFAGGPGVLVGASGGFVFGFLAVAIMCGFCKSQKNNIIKYGVSALSVLMCHIAGVIHFSFVTGNGILTSILCASLPFLLKDIAIVCLAQLVAKKIRL